jgi:hypothetical protein
MAAEKIGSDVLGYEPPRMSPKKRKELEKKLKEELAKKKRKEAEEGELEKLPFAGMPGEFPHDATPEERAEIIERELKKKKKKVHVSEHYRSRPKKKKKQDTSLFEEIF